MRRVLLTQWLTLVVLCGAGQPGFAADAPVSDDLTAFDSAIERAAQRLPAPQEVVAATRGRLAASIDELEQFLGRSGPEVSRGWSEWLDLPALKVELADLQPDIPKLRAIEQRYYRNHIGLEMAAFVAVRRELRGYLAARDYAAAPAPHDMYRQRLEELAQCIARLDAQPAQADAQRAGAIIAWLECLSDDGAALARSVRARYRRPNALAQVSGRFVNVLLSQNVEERHFITDTILGNLTQGPAFTSGHVSFGVVPSGEYGTLEVRLQGQTACPDNVAQRGRISIYSSANTTIQASKRVLFRDLGLELMPAAAWCQTDAQVNDVQARSRLLERVAWRRANQLLPEAEVAAARHAESQAGSKLDQRADAALGGVNDLFRQQLRAPLIRLDALPAQWRFWTDQDHLRMALVQSNDKQLAATGAGIELPLHYDLAMCGHESMVNNLCEAMLGGRTVQDQAWLDMMNLLTGSAPRPLWVHDRAERWSVTFAREQPVQARFSGEQVTLTLHLAALTRGQEHFDQEIEIEARLMPQINRDGPALVRDGDLAIRFATPIAPVAPVASEVETRQRAFLTRKFEAIFPAELYFNGLTPPTGGSLGKLRHLSLAEFSSSRGWLTLGYQIADASGSAK